MHQNLFLFFKYKIRESASQEVENENKKQCMKKVFHTKLAFNMSINDVTQMENSFTLTYFFFYR